MRKKNTVKSIKEARSIDLGRGRRAYKSDDKYYIRSGGTRKEISAEQYQKLLDKSNQSKFDSSVQSHFPDYKHRQKSTKNDVIDYLDKCDPSKKVTMIANTSFTGYAFGLDGKRVTGGGSSFSPSEVSKYLSSLKVRTFEVYTDDKGRDHITYKTKGYDEDGSYNITNDIRIE